MGDLISPGTRIGPTEDPKIHFNFLVYMFHFAIRLWVVGSGKGEVIVQEFSKFLDEGRSELQATVGDDFVIEHKMEVYFVKKEGGYPFGSDHFLSRADNYSLCKAMVDHNQ